MADRVQDEKLQDVLSSVRRLVSSELPRKEMRAASSGGAGALVLTSAQRVEGGARDRVAGKSLEERIAELEAAVSDRADDWEPDGSEDQAQHRPDSIVFSRDPSDSDRKESLRLSKFELVDPIDASGDDEAIAPTNPPTFRSRKSEPVPEAPMIEDVPPAPEKRADVVELQAFQDPDSMLDQVAARWSSAARGEAQVSNPSPAHPSAAQQPSEPAASAAPGQEATTEVTPAKADQSAAVKAEISSTPEATPDEEFEAALAKAVTASLPDTLADTFIEQSSEEDAPEKPAPIKSDPAVTATAAMAATKAGRKPDVALDTDALRSMVGDMIREELQGELGERITRNVRKLVRREILRALNARDID